MEVQSAGALSESTNQIKQLAAEEARWQPLVQPPEADGVELDPWEEFIHEIQSVSRPVPGKVATGESEVGDGSLPTGTSGVDRTHDGSGGASDIPIRYDYRRLFRSDSESSEPKDDFHFLRWMPRSPSEYSGADSAEPQAEHPTEQAACASQEAAPKLTSTVAKEDWEKKLDDNARAKYEQIVARGEVRRNKFEELKQLSEQANLGDVEAVNEINLILDFDEDFWRCYGDVASVTERMLLNALAGDVVSIVHSVQRSVASMKASMLGPSPTILEEMMVGRFIACWMFQNIVDRACVKVVQEGGRSSDLSKLQESAEKRLQTAVKSLKLVKGVELPADRQKQSTADLKSMRAESAA